MIRERCVYWCVDKMCKRINNFMPAGCNCDRWHTGTVSKLPACHVNNMDYTLDRIKRRHGEAI